MIATDFFVILLLVAGTFHEIFIGSVSKKQRLVLLTAILGVAYFGLRANIEMQSDGLHERMKGMEEYLRKSGNLNREEIVVKLDRIIYELQSKED